MVPYNFLHTRFDLGLKGPSVALIRCCPIERHADRVGIPSNDSNKSEDSYFPSNMSVFYSNYEDSHIPLFYFLHF